MHIQEMILFSTPESQEEINNWIMLHGTEERTALFTVMGMTWNYLAAEVNKDQLELGGAILKLMKAWDIPTGADAIEAIESIEENLHDESS